MTEPEPSPVDTSPVDTGPVERKRTELTDARAMRAYAHPLRLRLVMLLRRYGPHTATQAAKALDDNVPNCSFHLRQLAKYGLVERVEGSDNRERPWRAATNVTSWNDTGDDPERRAAADQLTGSIVNRYFEIARTWLQNRHRESGEWRNVTGISDQTLHVTVDEMAEVIQRIEDVMAPYIARHDDPSLRPADSRAITVVQLAMPWETP